MSDEMEVARLAVVDLWDQLDDGPRQALIHAVARAVAAGATARDFQEWLDSRIYGTD